MTQGLQGPPQSQVHTGHPDFSIAGASGVRAPQLVTAPQLLNFLSKGLTQVQDREEKGPHVKAFLRDLILIIHLPPSWPSDVIAIIPITQTRRLRPEVLRDELTSPVGSGLPIAALRLYTSVFSYDTRGQACPHSHLPSL